MSIFVLRHMNKKSISEYLRGIYECVCNVDKGAAVRKTDCHSGQNVKLNKDRLL